MITFVMAVYNTRIEWIDRAVDSVINQTKPDWELIIVDDGSGESVAQHCDELSKQDSRIHIHHQENQGLSVSRNYGMDNAQGQWVTFIDADDWIEQTYVEQVEKVLNKHCYLEMLAIGHDDIWGDNVIERLWGNEDYHEFDIDEKEDMQMALFQMPEALHSYPMFFGAQWKVIYSIEFLNRYNIRNTPGLNKAQDSVFNLYAVEYAEKIGYYNKVLYHYYHNSESVTGTKYTKDLERLRRLIKAYNDFVEQTNKKSDTTFQRAYKKRALIEAESMLACYFANKSNTDSVNVRRNRYNEVLDREPYLSLFIDYSMAGLSMYQKLLWLTLKNRNYLLSCNLYKIKNIIKR